MRQKLGKKLKLKLTPQPCRMNSLKKKREGGHTNICFYIRVFIYFHSLAIGSKAG